MNTPVATPGPSATLSPVGWMRTFAFTPDTDSSTRLQNDPQHPAADDNEDALPTRFRPRTRSRAASGGPHQICDFVDLSGEGNGSTVPAKRKRRRRGSEVLLSTADGFSVIHGSSTNKTLSRTWDASAMGENDSNHDKGPVPSRLRASLTCPRSGRVVLDAVEIINRKRSRPRTAKSACLTSSHYPSPPASHASKHVISSHSITNPEKRPSLDPALPLKPSKYFTPTSTLPTQSMPEYIPVATPPRSPTLTIPTYIKSSDSKYPPLGASLDKRENNSSDEPGCHNNPGLFNDLMVMLMRLKPILV